MFIRFPLEIVKQTSASLDAQWCGAPEWRLVVRPLFRSPFGPLGGKHGDTMTVGLDANAVDGGGPGRGGRQVEPMPAEIASIQPGGGFCMACELAWGRVRRWYLRRWRAAYLDRMGRARQGGTGTYPHEILDPRDLKFVRNQGDVHWRAEDDPFAWRGRLGLARVGWAEIILVGGGLLVLALLTSWLFWPLAILPLLLAGFVLFFFRDPSRVIPAEPGVVVSPADGRVYAIREVDHDEYVGGPAVVIDIFLSVLNVHLNRVPMDCRVIGMTYRRGRFLNALRAAAAAENESLELRLETTEGPPRGMRVRQVAGAIARRIVCWVRPGEHLSKGARFGMIKLGSRTELTIPREAGLEVCVRLGQPVQAGTTIMARYRS